MRPQELRDVGVAVRDGVPRSVDESSLGAFLTAFFEEQAPMIFKRSAGVNRVQDARSEAARHANRFVLKFVI